MVEEKANPRLIKSLTLSTGEKLSLFMPTMGQVYAGLIIERKPWIEVVVPASTNKTWDWYMNLSLLDGSIILMTLAPTIKAISNMIEALAGEGTTKH